MRKSFVIAVLTLLLSSLALADIYQQGRVVKWENGTYQQSKHKIGKWVVYYVQTDTITYEIARKKETKPKMQPGETVQVRVSKNKVTVLDDQGHKTDYEIVGQSQAAQ